MKALLLLGVLACVLAPISSTPTAVGAKQLSITYYYLPG